MTTYRLETGHSGIHNKAVVAAADERVAAYRGLIDWPERRECRRMRQVPTVHGHSKIAAGTTSFPEIGRLSDAGLLISNAPIAIVW